MPSSLSLCVVLAPSVHAVIMETLQGNCRFGDKASTEAKGRDSTDEIPSAIQRSWQDPSLQNYMLLNLVP